MLEIFFEIGITIDDFKNNFSITNNILKDKNLLILYFLFSKGLKVDDLKIDYESLKNLIINDKQINVAKFLVINGMRFYPDKLMKKIY
jgi:hypothetical protein